MKALNQLLAKALITTSAVLLPQTTITGNGSNKILLTDSSTVSRNGFMDERLASTASSTTQPRLPALLQSSSDPAWLWLWVFVLRPDWVAV
ncbi:hypothetical protein [Spirosoma arcticum]